MMKTNLFRSEAQFVKWLRTRAGPRPAGVRVGLGDDAAVVKSGRGRELILKTDMSVEGVHFDARLHPALSVGHRALARPLSDIAAMGGRSLAVPRLAKRRWIEEFYRGFLRLAKRFRVAVVGGDTAITVGGIYVDVALIGEATNGRPLLRSCARPGDMIYTSGRLGLSRMGLEALRWKRAAKRGTKRAGPWPGLGADKLALAIAAHLFPEPRIALGQFLARNRLASAAIDVSDGLSTDLAQLAEASGVGARIWANLVPEPWALAPAGVYPGGAGDRRRRRSESGAPARAPAIHGSATPGCAHPPSLPRRPPSENRRDRARARIEDCNLRWPQSDPAGRRLRSFHSRTAAMNTTIEFARRRAPLR
ncbi:MAG: thiamine-phosphate kinase [Acidobacteria bacterium]|nr:MAG: thiamine-phosphate kinase [Acidobacteriota bacterium]